MLFQCDLNRVFVDTSSSSVALLRCMNLIQAGIHFSGSVDMRVVIRSMFDLGDRYLTYLCCKWNWTTDHSSKWFGLSSDELKGGLMGPIEMKSCIDVPLGDNDWALMTTASSSLMPLRWSVNCFWSPMDSIRYKTFDLSIQMRARVWSLPSSRLTPCP